MKIMALAELHERNQILLAVATAQWIVRIRHHYRFDRDRRILEPLFKCRDHALAEDIVKAVDTDRDRDNARVNVEEDLVGT